MFDTQLAGFNWQTFIGSARFVACLIEEVNPIIYLGSDRCNFGWIKRYSNDSPKPDLFTGIWETIRWIRLTQFPWIGLFCGSIDRGDQTDHFCGLGSIWFWFGVEL
jgi:hypothetical protein